MATQTDLKATVKEKYGQAATRAATGAQAIGCCGSPTGCGGPDPITSNLYDADQQAGLPEAAVAASLGCGNPTALAELNAGETVLDLGSGGGIDVLLSAQRVGPTGIAYGLDMTDEMLALARENQAQGRRRERRVPQGRDRGDSAAGQLGRRHHLELRHQPVGATRPGAARGVPRARSPAAASPCPMWSCAARCPTTCRRTWSCGSAAWPARSRRRSTAHLLADAGFRRDRVWSRPGSTRPKTPGTFLAEAGLDRPGLAEAIDGRFISAFVRATKPGGEGAACCGPTCCA